MFAHLSRETKIQIGLKYIEMQSMIANQSLVTPLPPPLGFQFPRGGISDTTNYQGHLVLREITATDLVWFCFTDIFDDINASEYTVKHYIRVVCGAMATRHLREVSKAKKK